VTRIQYLLQTICSYCLLPNQHHQSTERLNQKNTFFGSMLNFFRPIDRCLEFGLFLQWTSQQSYKNDSSSVINITLIVCNTQPSNALQYVLFLCNVTMFLSTFHYIASNSFTTLYFIEIISLFHLADASCRHSFSSVDCAIITLVELQQAAIKFTL